MFRTALKSDYFENRNAIRHGMRSWFRLGHQGSRPKYELTVNYLRLFEVVRPNYSR